jgi:hypothetical protein
MLAYCVNESCNRPLHSFSEGRLFQFEIVSISVAATDDKSAPFDEKPQRQTLHLWLCGRCASTMSVVLEPTRGVKVVSLEEQNNDETRELSSATRNMPRGKEC